MKLNKTKYKLKKYILLLCFCIGGTIYAQEEEDFYTSDSIEEAVEDGAVFNEENNHLYEKSEVLIKTIPVDKTPIKVTPFDDLSKKYNSREFDYTKNEGQHFFSTLLEGIFHSFIKLWEIIFGKKENTPSVYDVYHFLKILLFMVGIFFIIRWALKSKNNWFFNRKVRKFNDISYNDVEKHINEVNFQQMIQKSENENNTRQSIRLYYLWLLKVLSDKKIIEWNIRKTNSDYEREIKNEHQKTDFIYLSKVYNYIWYGDFSINDAQYQSAKADYQKYINAQKN